MEFTVLRVCLHMGLYTLPHCGGGEEVGGLPVSALTDLRFPLFIYFQSSNTGQTLDKEILSNETEWIEIYTPAGHFFRNTCLIS